MKRIRQPFKTLVEEPLTRSLISKWREEEELTFPLDEMPTEVIIKIVYRHLNELLAVFQLNTRLREIEMMPGFWSGLLKEVYPEHALTLSAFLDEAPELTKLTRAALTDMLLLTSDFENIMEARRFRTFNSTLTPDDLPSLHQLETSLLVDGNIDALAPFYQYSKTNHISRTMKVVSFAFTDKENGNALKFVKRRSLIAFYLLIDEAQLPRNIADLLIAIISRAGDLAERGNYDLDEEGMNKFFDHWIGELDRQKLPRFKPYAEQMRVLKEKWQHEMKVISTPDPNTGLVPKPYSLYYPTLEARFQTYFALTDEEARVHWKKLYVQTAQQYVPTKMSFDAKCLSCASFKGKLVRDTRLNVLFCDRSCQSSFYTLFSE